MGEKERQYILIMVAMLFVLLAAYYYMYYVPLQKEKEQTLMRVEQLKAQTQSILKRVEKKETTPPQEQVKRIAELIPVQPYTDQLILDLGKLQSLGELQIENATFEEEKEVKVQELPNQFIPQAARQGQVPQQKSKQAINVQAAQNALPPVTIKSIEITLAIKGEYKNIYNFVTEAQDLSRYLRVDMLTFTSPEKDEFQIPKDKNLTASLKLTSYYAPQYASLLDKLPPVNVEPPSGKWDPTQYPVIKKENIQNPTPSAQ
ncbi:pilus assembly protein PilO [Aneurinibacillus sp. REN35]|uniref:pilus assembly protein PilO n=1 Tax=Aneurinibacillus sp. REN35 TaxID=3237286 RepID=UPI003529CFA0